MRVHFSARRRRILWAFLDALRPKGMPLDQDVDTDTLLVTFEDVFRYVDPKVRAVFPYLLDLWEYGAIPLAGRLRPFSRLSRREQEAYLRDWQESPLPVRRDLFKAMKAFFCVVYYDHPAVRKAIGYEHQAYAEQLRRERFERFGAEISAHEAWLHRGDAEPLPSTGAPSTEPK
jgi:hypothetical protein